MTKENVKAFYEALTKDESIQQALKAKEAAYAGAKEDREAIANEIVIPVAEAAGFTFTLDELKAYEQSMQTECELGDDELSAVAGGVDTWGACVGPGVGYGDSCFIIGVGACVVAGVGA